MKLVVFKAPKDDGSLLEDNRIKDGEKLMYSIYFRGEVNEIGWMIRCGGRADVGKKEVKCRASALQEPTECFRDIICKRKPWNSRQFKVVERI